MRRREEAIEAGLEGCNVEGKRVYGMGGRDLIF